MTDKNKGNLAKKIAAGALIAGAAGYLAGILTAPKSGKETRKDIKDATNKAMREAEKHLKSLHSQLGDLLDEAKSNSAGLSDKGKKELNELTAKARIAKGHVKEMLSAIHEGDADDPDLDQAVKSAKSAIRALQKYLKKR